jgi:hypothetical protein
MVGGCACSATYIININSNGSTNNNSKYSTSTTAGIIITTRKDNSLGIKVF